MQYISITTNNIGFLIHSPFKVKNNTLIPKIGYFNKKYLKEFKSMGIFNNSHCHLTYN